MPSKASEDPVKAVEGYRFCIPRVPIGVGHLVAVTGFISGRKMVVRIPALVSILSVIALFAINIISYACPHVQTCSCPVSAFSNPSL